MIKNRGVVILTREISERWIKLISESKLNVLGIHPFYCRQEYYLDKTINFFNSKRGKNFLNMLKELQIDYEFEVHAMSWLIYRKEYKNHKNWFRMNARGKRVKKYNFCFTNHEVQEQIMKNVKILAKKLAPSNDKYYIWQDDGKDVFCHCENCSKYSPSDQTLLIMNIILEALQDINANAKLAYLAYLNTIDIPTKIKPKKIFFWNLRLYHETIKFLSTNKILKRIGNILINLKV